MLLLLFELHVEVNDKDARFLDGLRRVGFRQAGAFNAMLFFHFITAWSTRQKTDSNCQLNPGLH